MQLIELFQNIMGGMKIENKPIKRIGIGSVRLSIWENVSNNGNARPWYTISLQRIYKDKEGKWQMTSNLSANDVPKALFALAKAYEFVMEQKEDDNPLLT